jgi:hypothetical protein
MTFFCRLTTEWRGQSRPNLWGRQERRAEGLTALCKIKLSVYNLPNSQRYNLMAEDAAVFGELKSSPLTFTTPCKQHHTQSMTSVAAPVQLSDYPTRDKKGKKLKTNAANTAVGAL